MPYSLLGIIAAVLAMWVAAWTLRATRARQALLLLASYTFYSTWGFGFLSILVASSLFNFAWGTLLRRRMTPACLWTGVLLNLALLALFKYVPPLLSGADVPGSESSITHAIIMPVGMSFWTFQALSYLFDVYREEEIDPSLIEFCLFMAFWPVVLAGPVCRMPDMLPQFRKPPVLLWSDVSAGARRLALGAFQKVVLAQLLHTGLVYGQGVAAGFDEATRWGGLDIWLLGIGFGFLLLFDFGGYSHMVIGTARLFGIQLPENFDRPFLARTPSVFWTRWHMSLSFWIRDYVFLPLAAASRNRHWPYAVFLIAMTLFGLWHAATWPFILWGLYHGAVLVVHRIGQLVGRRFDIRAPAGSGGVLAWGATFLAVSLGWILFRVDSLDRAVAMLGTALTPSAYAQLAMPPSFYVLVIGITAAYFAYYGMHGVLSEWRDASLHSGVRRSFAISVAGGRLVNSAAGTFWWWFGPTAAVVTTFVGIAAYRLSVPATVTPFIYTLF